MNTQNAGISQKLDIEKIFKERSPKVYKLTPKFFLRYLKKISHEDDMNAMFDSIGHLYGNEFTDAVVKYYNMKSTLIGKTNLPKEGRYIFVSNHPIGGIDGILFLNEVNKLYGSCRAIVNDLLMNIKNFAPLLVGVNKTGQSVRNDIIKLEKTFASDKQMLMFPAGLASRKINKEIKDSEWKKTFVVKAIQHKRDIVPVHFSGRLSNFFYNLANIRTFLGIKINIEMLYLADESYKQRNKNYRITFGKPISYKLLENSKYKPKELAEKIKNHVYLLKNNPDINFTLS